MVKTTKSTVRKRHGNVISACTSKGAPDESGIYKDFPEKATERIATAGNRCTDGTDLTPVV